jgi:hypothetical protein
MTPVVAHMSKMMVPERRLSMRIEISSFEGFVVILLAALPHFHDRWVGVYLTQQDAVAHAKNAGLLHPEDVEALSEEAIGAEPFLNEPLLVPKQVLAQFMPYRFCGFN